MNAKNLKLLLNDLSACQEAIAWVEGKSLAVAWAECPRADWLLWLAGRMVGQAGWPDKPAVVRCAALCAETVLAFIPANETRPRAAIDATLAWVDNPTIENKNAAYAAANAADVCAAKAADVCATFAANAAAYAANAAAYTSRAAYATFAVYAAANANIYAAANANAYATADAAARLEQHEIMCGIVRQNLNVANLDKKEK